MRIFGPRPPVMPAKETKGTQTNVSLPVGEGFEIHIRSHLHESGRPPVAVTPTPTPPSATPLVEASQVGPGSAPADSARHLASILSESALPETDNNAARVTIPTYAAAIQRAMQLVPTVEQVESSKDFDGQALTMKSSDHLRDIIADYLPLESSERPAGLFAATKQRLDELWANGDGHNRFDHFVSELSSQRIVLQCDDKAGKNRTIYNGPRRFNLPTVRDTDKGSAKGTLGPAFLKQYMVRSSYIDTNAATALVVQCLARKDAANVARICAGGPPTVINALLEESEIGRGPIFTEFFIWPLLAATAARVGLEGGLNRGRLVAASNAFANFLTYHKHQGLRPSYVKPLQKLYHRGGEKADALVNNPTEFGRVIEKLWTALASEETPITSILDRPKPHIDLDTEVGAYLINLVFSGVDIHLRDVESRKKSYFSKIKTSLDFVGTAPVDAIGKAAGGIDDGVTSSLVTKSCDLLLSAGASALSSICSYSDPVEMKTQYAALYHSVRGSNSVEGRFVVGEQILNNSALKAFSRNASGGPIVRQEQVDKKSTLKSATTIRAEWENTYRNLPPEKYEEIKKLRLASGQHMSELLDEISLANSATPQE